MCDKGALSCRAVGTLPPLPAVLVPQDWVTRWVTDSAGHFIVIVKSSCLS